MKTAYRKVMVVDRPALLYAYLKPADLLVDQDGIGPPAFRIPYFSNDFSLIFFIYGPFKQQMQHCHA